MYRYKPEKKKTRDELIDILIIQTARRLTVADKSYKPMEFVNSKNLDTLQAMTKKGLIEYAPYSKDSFKFTDKGMAQYGSLIRDLALAMLQTELNQESKWRAESLESAHLELYLRFCATDAKKEYWTNTPEFSFITWRFRDDMGRNRSVGCNDHLNSVRLSEERIQEIEQNMAFVEVTTIPRVELCAMR